ncbi:DNA-processing protein DprA [Spelaeicoccus albus]|uniref:DNA processing protein n=1 Tax=Spelaeicoccus albus TaxID=1280376 RepID=A0A7Z0D2N0_9MICO|nr:DNA-processing protein DprA [Spelaeicoccus albus]NYI67751.1 DNA processing protein [Spelaeicoccus albus]
MTTGSRQAESCEPDAERVARAELTRLVEPCDTVASTLVGVAGAVETVRWIRSGRPAPQEWQRAVVGTLMSEGQAGAGARFAAAASRWRARASDVDGARDLRNAALLGARLVIPGDDEWPSGMADLGSGAPLALWVRGTAHLAGSLTAAVSIVGARAASAYGVRVAGDISDGLIGRGECIVSGGAYGIDSAAHGAACLTGGSGERAATVAFLAGGIDRLYPPGNAQVFERVLRDGLIVAEVAPGSAPMKSRFLLRNRLIAAASRATVVVEAGWRSGALSTANRAAELMRDVGAVPGSVFSATSAGCHRLIRDGVATLVSDVSDVIELAGRMGADLAQPPQSPVADYDNLMPVDRQVLDALPLRHGAGIEALTRVAGLGDTEVRSAIARLELAGLTRRDGAGWKKAGPMKSAGSEGAAG